jgi:hypothetical protein
VRKLRKLTAIIITLGISAMLYGLYRGEAALIMKKAARVCLECIGIG